MQKFSDSECWQKYVRNLKTVTISYGEQNFILTLNYFNTSYNDSPEVFTYYELETTDLNTRSSNHIFCENNKDGTICHNKKTNTLSIGGINAYNELTQSLLDLIMTPDNVLQTKCGRVDPTCYRSQLVKIINELYD